MTPDDLRAVYYIVLLDILNVLEADQAAAALVARDALSRWWEVTE